MRVICGLGELEVDLAGGRELGLTRIMPETGLGGLVSAAHVLAAVMGEGDCRGRIPWMGWVVNPVVGLPPWFDVRDPNDTSKGTVGNTSKDTVRRTPKRFVGGGE